MPPSANADMSMAIRAFTREPSLIVLQLAATAARTKASRADFV
jgi:hypothetical protein